MLVHTSDMSLGMHSDKSSSCPCGGFGAPTPKPYPRSIIRSGGNMAPVS